MKEIELRPIVGSFAENKDKAQKIRTEEILPAIEGGEKVILDFNEVGSATQSFIHALISDLLRRYGGDVLDVLFFKNCNEEVQKIISIVIEYMQESE
jgi:hypothetical protein